MPVQEPTPENGTMMQAFEWYVSADGKHLQRLARDLSSMRSTGITALWIPPQCKGQRDLSHLVASLTFSRSCRRQG